MNSTYSTGLKPLFVACIVSSFLGASFAIWVTWPKLQASSQAEVQRLENDARQEEPVFRKPSEPETRSESSIQPAVRERVFTDEEKVNIAVYENGSRSVVNIRTVSQQADMFSFRAVESEGSGSGWVVDKTGLIVTNHHVVEDSDFVEVKLYNGLNREAKVVGADPANDIALLKIAAPEEHLFPVSFGDSSTLKVGQKVFAIGSPFGLEQTMTTGIVSSLNRTIRSRAGRLINSIIQIDAALNRGNSGGALLDTQGNLVGMNTAIKSRIGENTGVGFAIPANTIARVVTQLKENGRVIRSSIGIAKVFPRRDGLGIYSFTDNSPAKKAGLKSASVIVRRQQGNRLMAWRDEDPSRADVIVGINEVAIDSVDKLLAEVEKYKPGTKISVDIIRAGRRVSVPVTLEEDR